MLATRELQTGGGLIADLETFQRHDADIFLAAFPDLALT
jgi:hypothetical protein